MPQLTFEDFLVLRRPLLPLQTALNVLDQYRSKELLGEQLKRIFAEPVVAESLYVASPVLYGRLEEWQADQPIAEKDKLIQTLAKYYLRMSSRCTPYGLFAGCSTVEFKATTNVTFSNVRRYTRLDMNYVAELSQWLQQIPGVTDQLLYYPNNSLYRIGNQYRYMAYYLEGGKRTYVLTSAEAMPEIESLLEASNTGAKLPQLALVLQQMGISAEESSVFLDELVAAQVLVSEFEPSVTGEEYFKRLSRKVESLAGLETVTQSLDRVGQLLAQPEGSAQLYRSIQQILTNELLPPPGQHLFQTDLYFDTQEATISHQVAKKITPLLNRLLVFNRTASHAELDQFKREFYDRYEEQEVPLLLALDNEVGIPYGEKGHADIGHTPLIDDLCVNQPDSPARHSPTETNLTTFLLEKLTNALRTGDSEINITDQDLKRLEAQSPVPNELPASLYAFGSLLADSMPAIDQGDFQFLLHSLSGPSSANLLSRFCHGSAALTEKVRSSLAYEASQYPDALLAEIVHLSEARTGNILLRPTLRAFEIPYLATSGADPDHLIALTDLLISVPQGKQIIIRSRRLKKRVIPRLTSAHNYVKGLPVYRFLADLQHQEGTLQVSWDWALLRNQVYLPRVCYRNIILSRATWNLTTALHQAPSASAFAALQEKLHLNIPQYVVMREGDNELLLDLTHDVCLSILMDTLRKSGTVQLSEFLQIPARCWLTDEKGKYTNEVIFPLRSKRTIPQPTTQTAPPDIALIQQHPIGSQWLYFKIYTGEKTADKLLTTVLEPLVDRWLGQQLIDRFFFVRYRDPYPHLRVRFRGVLAQQDEFHRTLINELYSMLEPYFQERLIHNVVADSYRPELERYGTDTMAGSEHLFHIDSRSVIQCLQELVDDDAEAFRWLLALRGLHDLLNAFAYTLPAKVQIVKQLQASFFNEFGGDAALRTQLNTKYRNVTDQIQSVLDAPEMVLSSQLCSVLVDRQAQIQALATDLLRQTTQLDALVSSYGHMFLNRLFISNHRLHELVIYHFLFRHYSTTLARQS